MCFKESELINTMTFEIDNATVQIVNEQVLLWRGLPDTDADIEISLDDLLQICAYAMEQRQNEQTR